MADMIRFVKLDPAAKAPVRGSAQAAGVDLCAINATDILPGHTAAVHTGIAVELPEGYVGLIFARSGIATRRGLAPSNKVGVIDADYRGELIVSLYNQSAETQSVFAGERIAQMCVVPCLMADFVEADSLSGTERGEGGFGSTGRV